MSASILPTTHPETRTSAVRNRIRLTGTITNVFVVSFLGYVRRELLQLRSDVVVLLLGLLDFHVEVQITSALLGWCPW